MGHPRGPLRAHGSARLPNGQTRRRRSRARLAQAWELAARAPARLEGELSSHSRKLDALERRGRALRAEIGRKVEELAHEESRALRESRGRAARGVALARAGAGAERTGARPRPSRRRSGHPAGRRPPLRAIFERAGAARRSSRRAASTSRSASRRRRWKDDQARDLRRQIDELRAQLSRYAEALEEDLAAGREKVAARTREGLAFEKAFSEVSSLLNHLKAKPEARDLLSLSSVFGSRVKLGNW